MSSTEKRLAFRLVGLLSCWLVVLSARCCDAIGRLSTLRMHDLAMQVAARAIMDLRAAVLFVRRAHPLAGQRPTQ